MAKQKISAATFEGLCSQVSDCILSLKSCIAREVPAEALRVRCALNELCAADLARTNERLIERRRILIRNANDLLASRVGAA